MNSNWKKALCTLVIALGIWKVYVHLVIAVTAFLELAMALITGLGYAIIAYGLCRLIINPGLVLIAIARIQAMLAQIPTKIKQLFN